MVNSSEVSIVNQDSNSASDEPPYESVDQGQLFDVEERPKRPRSIQSIYAETQEIEDDEVFFISEMGSMKTPCDMADFGLLNSYLGIKEIQGSFEIRLCQKLYALKVLDEFNMIECN